MATKAHTDMMNQRIAWRQALVDQRVVRYTSDLYTGGYRLTSYPTHEMRDAAIVTACHAGVTAEIITDYAPS